MCSEKDGLQLPKEFEKKTEVLPLTKYGITTYNEFKKAEDELQHQERLKRAGLTDEEITLYEQNKAGLLEECKKIEANVLKDKLQIINEKIQKLKDSESSNQDKEPSTSTSKCDIFSKLHSKPLTYYPEGHPMNEIKEIEESLFGHLKNDDIIPITKRRKILRRLERKKHRILSADNQSIIPVINSPKVSKPGSLWDVRKLPSKVEQKSEPVKRLIGPQKQTLYTIKDNKIVRLEPINKDNSEIKEGNQNERLENQEYRAVDIVLPINTAEQQLLEGTKMSLEDIKKIERFKNYEPGIPSKVLYLKNIDPSVTQEQISLLFNQFVLDNKGPIDVRLLSGRMRGQAFVTFQDENLAIRALEEVNGTILSGKPIIVQFGRNSNRIQDENR